MKKILKLAKELEEAKADIVRMKLIADPLKEKKDEIQAKLIAAMEEMELKSIKTNTNSYSMAVRRTISVYDSQAVIEDMKLRDPKESYTQVTLDVKKFEGYSKALLKESGEMVDGTDINETPYITIKAVKPK